MKATALLLCALITLTVLGAFAPAHASAPFYIFYMTIDGIKSGVLRGDTTYQAKPVSLCRAFEFEMALPVDPASGMATGKRQYQPLTVTKEWGAASPQIFQAAADNENLRTVVLQFPTVTPDGRETPGATITLKNAVISRLRYFVAPVGNPEQPEEGRLQEQISFTYQSLEVTGPGGAGIADTGGNFILPRPLVPAPRG
jgi:type VI secretion system secreted protein Hcp